MVGDGGIVTGEFFFFFFFFFVFVSVVDNHVDHHIHMYYPELTRSLIELAFCRSHAPARARRVQSLNHPLMNQSRFWFIHFFFFCCAEEEEEEKSK